MGARLLVVLLLTGLVCSSAAVGGPTVYDGAGTAQDSAVQYFPPRTGAGVIVDFDSYTSDVLGAPIPVANVIRYAYGTRWNGRLFPHCALSALRAAGPAACPSGSLFARGFADVPPAHHLTVKAFISTVKRHDAQLFWVSPGVVIVGLLSANGHAITERIDLHGLPLVEQFHVTDLRLVWHHTPLTTAPTYCPPTGWVFTFTSEFASGPDLVSRNHQPCLASKS